MLLMFQLSGLLALQIQTSKVILKHNLLNMDRIVFSVQTTERAVYQTDSWTKTAVLRIEGQSILFSLFFKKMVTEKNWSCVCTHEVM